MKKATSLVLVCVLAVLSFPGCQSAAGKGAGLGAFLGGVVGAGVALATGHGDNVLGYAAAGAAAGAATGYLIGRAKDRRVKDRNEAIAQANYNSSQGTLMRIEGAAAAPASLQAGQVAAISCDYVVISPDARQSIPVKAYCTLRSGNQSLVEHQENLTPVANGGGVLNSEFQMTIPKNAPSGTYTFNIRLVDGIGGKESTRAVQLYVS